jgi:hypothetical protein
VLAKVRVKKTMRPRVFLGVSKDKFIPDGVFLQKAECVADPNVVIRPWNKTGPIKIRSDITNKSVLVLGACSAAFGLCAWSAFGAMMTIATEMHPNTKARCNVCCETSRAGRRLAQMDIILAQFILIPR